LVDALDIRDIGMGSLVSQFDQVHILTLRVMLRGFNNDAFAQNNLMNVLNQHPSSRILQQVNDFDLGGAVQV